MQEGHVIVVDDDDAVRDSMRAMLELEGLTVQCHALAACVLEEPIRPDSCLVTDIRMPGMSGLELQEELVRRKITLPVIIITGHADVPMAVRAMQAGALEFIEKPVEGELLLEAIKHALQLGKQIHSHNQGVADARDAIHRLTPRERDILENLVQGFANKVVAQKLGISPRTVEIHRASVMRKLGTKNLSAMVRLAIAAEQGG